ncbi:hypothetical protein [Streptomyces sp. NBC_00582]|uniref:hypothetical protein n=1 Tax=Streptomyces sp. NBC_00582 TaxID=2975783 RepID=UPI002E7FECEC|nr:hypothetical protein [Streptomyces sp. NBC_00582]WUB63077.1 hypothetical protein OG852_23040 [Streptomyces sp. NBC_00582]
MTYDCWSQSSITARPGATSHELLIYQHSDEERQRDVAAGLDDMVRYERAKHLKANRTPV